MSVIVDTNVVSAVLNGGGNVNSYRSLYSALTNRQQRACLVYGGKLLTEYCRNGGVKKIIEELDRAGRSHRVEAPELAREEQTLACRSNDVHIIALARISGARLICTEDRHLMSDVRTKSLLDRPRGKVLCQSTRNCDNLIEEAWRRWCRLRRSQGRPEER